MSSSDKTKQTEPEDDKKKGFVGTFKSHTTNIMLWGGFLTASLIVYFIVSSRDFSFLLTYASFMRFFGVCLLNYKMLSQRSGQGVSAKSLQLYLLVFLSRLLSILRHQGYLPFDKTGDWFYHCVEIGSLIGVALALAALLGPFRHTHQTQLDNFGNLVIPSFAGVLYVVLPCLLLALLVHPTLNKEFLADTCWALSMYLEACAMLPQIYMFQKQSNSQGGVVEVLVGHTVFAVAFARLFELVFWLGSFKELVDSSGSGLPGYAILLSQVAHLALMADFFYYYFLSLSRGVPIALPSVHNTDNV